MLLNLVTGDAFAKLNILREKAEVALGCIMDDSKCQHIQVLADIANDYISAMGDMIEAMQESPVHYPS